MPSEGREGEESQTGKKEEKKIITGEKVKEGRAQPIFVSLCAHSLSVATLVVVSDGVDIWVATRFLHH